MEAIIRLSAALSIFLIMISWEYLNPRRKQPVDRKLRWPTNIGLAALNMLLMRVLPFGAAAYLSAITAAERGWGLLNWFALPNWLSFTVTLLALDFAIYGQHVISHKWTPLWRLHQVHHTDLVFDATTAVRFHPLEILISMAYKVVCVYLLGAEPLAVITFEIILNGAATFNHSNVNIPVKLDEKLRWLVITPDMHRIHHSTVRSEMDSNYGFSISCWDRLCRTYVAEPSHQQTQMEIGLKPFRNRMDLGFLKLLLLPFKALRRH
ncbi:MAG: sterol desaturase family protein [Gammaproteobacteria bacterium]